MKLKNGMQDLWGIVRLERKADSKIYSTLSQLVNHKYDLTLRVKILICKKLQRSEFVEIYNKFFPHGNATKFSQFVFDVFEKVQNNIY